jgi:hypothetical protein
VASVILGHGDKIFKMMKICVYGFILNTTLSTFSVHGDIFGGCLFTDLLPFRQPDWNASGHNVCICSTTRVLSV